MQKTINANKRIIAIILCIATILGCMPFQQASAYAAENKVTLSQGERIEYGTHFTTRMYVDGNSKNMAYCLEPGKWTPDEAAYNYEELGFQSDLRKAVYYLQGGYGYDKNIKEKYLSNYTEDQAYVISHLVVSYIYDDYQDGGDAFMGTPENYIAKAKEIAAAIKKLPDPPKTFKAFILKKTGGQDIVGSWFYEPMGWIELFKSSNNEQVSVGNPNYTLAGAKYGIYDGEKLVETLITDDKGYAKSGKIEEGSYTLKEITPSGGYAIDVNQYEVNVITDKTVSVKVKETPQNSPLEIILSKIDSETGKSKAQGGATLAGAEFKVEFYAVKNGADISSVKPARSWTFKTDENGKIRLSKNYLVSGDEFYYQLDGVTPCMPLGTVVIKETKASEGYLLNNKTYTVEITSEGTAETVKTYNVPGIPEQVKRGDLEFVKVSDGDLNRLAGVPFKITSLTTGESHVIVTDKNGYASTNSEWNKHTVNTNRGETSEDGIWFGEAAPDDSKGALIYDDYELEELRCEANEGMNLLKFKVSIYKDKVTVPLGTLTDDNIEIHTEAMDENTESHFGKAEEQVTIIDTVSYEGLKKGKEYTLRGVLMDKETGEPVYDGDKMVSAEKIFTADSSKGKVKMEFKVDGKLLSGRAVVVFEDLYQDSNKLASHADIADEGQTVYFPEIATEAKDKDTESNTSIAGEKVTIIDIVSYEGLQKGKEYKVTGTLMDKETGKPVLVEGEEVVITKEFTAENSSGEIEMAFEINASELDGKDIVVFEELYKGERKLAVHADIEDEKQTIHFPEIKTKAEDGKDGDQTVECGKEVTIKDTVSYKGLIAGKEYTVKGILMDKDTGKTLEVDGKTVESETTFTADKADGEVEVVFNLDASSIEGKKLVVFEKLYYKDSETEVANHEDIDDEGQTVNVDKKPEKEKEPEKEVPPADNTPYDNPKTGDDSNVGMWIVLLILAGAGITAVKISSRKKEIENERDDQ